MLRHHRIKVSLTYCAFKYEKLLFKSAASAAAAQLIVRDSFIHDRIYFITTLFLHSPENTEIQTAEIGFALSQLWH